MFGRLKNFLKGNFTVRATSAQQAMDEMHIELLALPEVRKDFTTPEGAILCLEDAYRRRDIEAAVAAKDFKTEARLMLQRTGFGNCITVENVAKLANTLELSFRAHTHAKWPEFEQLESYFPKRVQLGGGIIAVTEVCRFPDGFYSQQEILVNETPDGGRVLHSRKADVV
jgi:hypothetical protein